MRKTKCGPKIDPGLDPVKVFKGIKGKIKPREPLFKHTTFRIGGPAVFFIEPKDLRDLKSVAALAKKNRMPLLVIGAGSNLLVSDQGVRAWVVRLSAPFFKNVSFRGDRLTAGSGMRLGELIREAGRRSLAGMEFLAGIPGTLGGALAMNAGAWGRSIGQCVENVLVMDYNGKTRILRKKALRFGYRRSNLSKYIILAACLNLDKKTRDEIRRETKEYILGRKNSQDLSFPNAGCIFRNPPGRSAGRLIDQCGLKGRGRKGALISWKHANFILNRGAARFKDVHALMDLAQKTVNKKFNIKLKPEIKIWE